jgi:hypothetical protein
VGVADSFAPRRKKNRMAERWFFHTESTAGQP